nr:MAG TPA: hypothetical protein [Caudoviricetes sp.]
MNTCRVGVCRRSSGASSYLPKYSKKQKGFPCKARHRM